MNKKIIVFDLDGTLLNSTKEIPEKSVEIIKQLYGKGHQFILATARPLRTASKFAQRLHIPVLLILQNGACYFNTDNELVSNYLDKELVISIVEFILKHDADSAVSIMSNDEWYTISDYDYASFYRSIDITPEKITKEELYTYPCTKILVNNTDKGMKIKETFYDKALVILTDTNALVQIMSKSASKEAVLAKILVERQKTKEDVICFGDDYNDIGMFTIAGYSFAMGNSIQELKDIADYVADTNDDDGIYNFFTSVQWDEVENGGKNE